ncbi:MAG: hypothetical protein IT454_09010 [Planctomycetes bacterium]|nr:hypothetical protein [Planctomycetota bacterium]
MALILGSAAALALPEETVKCTWEGNAGTATQTGPYWMCGYGHTRWSAYDDLEWAINDLPGMPQCSPCEDPETGCIMNSWVFFPWNPEPGGTLPSDCWRVGLIWTCCSFLPEGTEYLTLCTCGN